MKLAVNSRSGTPFFKSTPVVSVPATATVAALKEAITKASRGRLGAERQRLAFDGKPLGDDDGVRLNKLGLRDGDEVVLKDLGPQIGWRTVFFWEYLGPIVIHAWLFFFPQYAYFWLPSRMTAPPAGARSPLSWAYYEHQLWTAHTPVQTITLLLVVLHFFKRELETFLVHRFSHATMPRFNLLKNSAHYWALSGLLLGGSVYYPAAARASLPPLAQNLLVGWTSHLDPVLLVRLCAALWVVSELSNLHTHWTLRQLRPPGTRERRIPYGYGFTLVSCPNYYFETMAWVAVSVLTGSAGAWLFTLVSFAQMAAWAKKKHIAYRREFGERYPRSRRILIPFLW